MFYLYGDAELRSRDVQSGRETTLYHGTRIRHLARSSQRLARLWRRRGFDLDRAGGGRGEAWIQFEGVTELEWQRDLIAGRNAELWRIPLQGSAPQKLEGPGNREMGFSLHPDGKRLALTAGK